MLTERERMIRNSQRRASWFFELEAPKFYGFTLTTRYELSNITQSDGSQIVTADRSSDYPI